MWPGTSAVAAVSDRLERMTCVFLALEPGEALDFIFFFLVSCAGCIGHCFLFGSLSPRAADDYALVCALMDTELLKPGDPLFILVISLYVF